MDNARYVAHLKVLGKLCYLYDQAEASSTAMTTLRATTLDQASTGASADLPASDLIARYMPSWSGAITSGADSLRDLAVTIATNYMRDSYFRDDLTTAPDSTSIAHVIAAWETDAGAGLDNKSFTTEGSSGLVNFFDVLKGSETTFQQSGSPSYADGTYVVSAVI